MPCAIMKWNKWERQLPRPRFSLAVQVSDYRNQSSQDSNYVSHNLKGFFYFSISFLHLLSMFFYWLFVKCWGAFQIIHY